MKKIILTLSFISVGLLSFGQSDIKKMSKEDLAVTAGVDEPVDERYVSTMSGLIMKMNAANSIDAFEAAGNGFERIAEAENAKWLPKYYAAYCKIRASFISTDKEQTDKMLDAADELLLKAWETNPNDEIKCLEGMSQQARINVDPMSRGAIYGPKAAATLAVASEMNPANPRPDFLKGQSAFYTPEAFGGGKKVAKKYFQSCIDKFAQFEQLNNLMPQWGLEASKAMLAQCEK